MARLKTNVKYEHRFKVYGVLFSLFYWVGESVVHFWIFGDGHLDIVSMDANELWMRLIIVFLILVLTTYMDHFTYLLRKKDQEKIDVFLETVAASHHILNNLLNQMGYYRMVAQKAGVLNDDDLEIFDLMVSEAKEQIMELEKLQAIDVSSIKKIYP